MESTEIRPGVVMEVSSSKLYDYKGELKLIGHYGESENQFWRRIEILNPDRSDSDPVQWNPELIGIRLDNVRLWLREYCVDKDLISLGYSQRGFLFTVHKAHDDKVLILAGCRDFTIEKAKEHWKDRPDELAKVHLGEQIAKELGWIKPDTFNGVEGQAAIDSFYEPQVTAGELAGETVPTIAILPESDSFEEYAKNRICIAEEVISETDDELEYASEEI